ncbi:MAG: DsrE family protein [Thiomicrospira sp.]|uniref:DsrE family protein n=1 Tax=Thiomicrospira sp. TaxID=935 RepID=UPI0019FD2AD3|nr:DsrE family protein [Thiomicrospira sp.]MBE0493764.1 DsrE family protein [Thiomicrospira sp.]
MKTLTTLFSITLASLLALTSTQSLATENKYSEQKVIYHVNYDDIKRQGGALRNIQNHINGVGADRLNIKVVMHGNGIELLRHAKTDPALQARVDNLKSQGVDFNICANTLKGKNIALNELYDAKQSDIVPSGVAELAHLQQQGYMYLRP